MNVRPNPKSAPALLLLFVACSTPTYSEQAAEVQTAFAVGDFEAARAATAEILQVGENDAYTGNGNITGSTAALLDLEMAVLDLADGKPSWAAERAALANRQFEAMLAARYSANFFSDMGEALEKLADPDLTTSAYYGSDWEHVLCMAMTALAELARGRPDNAESTTGGMQDLALGWLEAWQKEVGAANEHLEDKIDASAEKFLMTGLPFFLEGLCVEAQGPDIGAARKSYEKALELEKRAANTRVGAQAAVEAGLQSHLDRATSGGLASDDTARVWVVCMTDKLAHLEESSLRGSALIENIATFVSVATGLVSREQLPRFTNITVGRLNTPPPPFDLLEVQLDDDRFEAMPLVTDLQPVIETSYDRTVVSRIFRAITLRIAKGLIAESVKQVGQNEVLDEQEDWVKTLFGWLIEAFETLWVVAEYPDTRSWRLLPRRVYCARIEIPATAERQPHQITIRATSGGRPVVRTITCDLRADEDSFVLTMLPDATTPTATYWSTENGESWCVPANGGARIRTPDQPLDRTALVTPPEEEPQPEPEPGQPANGQ